MLGSNEFKLHGAGSLFIIEKLLGKSEAFEYYQRAKAEQISLIQYLVQNNILTATQIAQAMAQYYDSPLFDLDCIDIESLPLTLVHDKLIRNHSIIPLFCRDTDLYLATDDPGKHAALKEIQFHTGLNVQVIVVETDKLNNLLSRLFPIQENQHLFKSIDEELSATADDSPIVQWINKILLDAIKLGASDIHFEPFETEYRIRYRQDGVLHEIIKPPAHLSARITSRIKIMGNLDISERRMPQDGRFKMNTGTHDAVDFRVSTCPTAGGEKIVLRILDPATAKLDINNLGLSLVQKEHFIRAISRPQGMILITGPTGSGKTVSLYSALNRLNTPEVNISTVEDPVEIKVTGINQVPVNNKSGLTFSSALQAFLRQDPDIIMIGEIRDLETAEIAVKAAQTGHLVLSTLHTNSAAETLNRLINMGIPTFNIGSSITLIIAQRLARKLCTHCKTPRNDFTQAALMQLGFSTTDFEQMTLYKAKGCDQCTDGYKGRIGLFEVLPMSPGLSQLIMSGANSLDILKTAQTEGMISIYQSGLEKIKEGLTTLEEVNRVTVE